MRKNLQDQDPNPLNQNTIKTALGILQKRFNRTPQVIASCLIDQFRRDSAVGQDLNTRVGRRRNEQGMEKRELHMLRLAMIAEVFVTEGNRFAAVQNVYPELQRRTYIRLIREINELALKSIESYLRNENNIRIEGIRGDKRNSLLGDLADVHMWLKPKSIDQFETYKKFVLRCHRPQKQTRADYLSVISLYTTLIETSKNPPIPEDDQPLEQTQPQTQNPLPLSILTAQEQHKAIYLFIKSGNPSIVADKLNKRSNKKWNGRTISNLIDHALLQTLKKLHKTAILCKVTPLQFTPRPSHAHYLMTAQYQELRDQILRSFMGTKITNVQLMKLINKLNEKFMDESTLPFKLEKLEKVQNKDVTNVDVKKQEMSDSQVSYVPRLLTPTESQMSNEEDDKSTQAQDLVKNEQEIIDIEIEEPVVKAQPKVQGPLSHPMSIKQQDTLFQVKHQNSAPFKKESPWQTKQQRQAYMKEERLVDAVSEVTIRPNIKEELGLKAQCHSWAGEVADSTMQEEIKCEQETMKEQWMTVSNIKYKEVIDLS